MKYTGINELTEFVATKNGLSKLRCRQIIDDMCNAIIVGLVQEPHKVNVPRLGTFERGNAAEIIFTPTPMVSSIVSNPTELIQNVDA